MKWLLMMLRSGYRRLQTLVFPTYEGDLFDVQLEEQGRFVIFSLSQIGALAAAAVVLYLYASSSLLVVAALSFSIVLILLNCFFLRAGLYPLHKAALIFAVNAYLTQMLLLIKTNLHSIIVIGFFPSVIAGFLFLGIIRGSLHYLMYVVLIVVDHVLYKTEYALFLIEVFALTATFLIAYFYELVSERHTRLLALSLERMTYLAKTDQLTGLLNRWEFFSQVSERLKQECEFAMLMLDVDDFKSINDTYGHIAGDQALRSVAMTIKAHIRDSEVFGRIGGEEFAILLPLDEEHAFDRAESIRKAVEKIQMRHNDTELKLSLSIGITNVCSSERELSEVLKRADKGLYKAKELGKNVTVVWNE